MIVTLRMVIATEGEHTSLRRSAKAGISCDYIAESPNCQDGAFTCAPDVLAAVVGFADALPSTIRVR